VPSSERPCRHSCAETERGMKAMNKNAHTKVEKNLCNFTNKLRQHPEMRDSTEIMTLFRRGATCREV
jgi:hypothetical protein